MSTKRDDVTIDDFRRFCDSRGVTLMPHQVKYAESILASDTQTQFMMGGMASGRTLTNALLESFFDLQLKRRA